MKVRVNDVRPVSIDDFVSQLQRRAIGQQMETPVDWGRIILAAFAAVGWLVVCALLVLR